MIAIDKAHCDLIYGLVVSAKPRDVLELGYGTGASSLSISEALEYNENALFNSAKELQAKYTIVDNWNDWNGEEPDIHQHRFSLVTMDETEFCSNLQKDSYDFILSDADHANAEKNAGKLFYALRSPGILIFHDVTNPGWPNLRVLLGSYANSVLFNKSSRQNEECDRGLLVIFR